MIDGESYGEATAAASTKTDDLDSTPIDTTLVESLANLLEVHDIGLSVQWPPGYDALSAAVAIRNGRSRASQATRSLGSGGHGSGGSGIDTEVLGTSRVARLPTGSQAAPRTFSFHVAHGSSLEGQVDDQGGPPKLPREPGTTTANEDDRRNVRPRISVPSIDEELEMLNRR